LGTAYTPRIAQGTLIDYWISTHPWATQSEAAWQPSGTFAAPRFVIEEVGTQATGGGLGIGAVGSSGIYRITARGVGRSSNTVVILQSVYEQ
jgi:type IV pilus assembly protein PilX